jgi:hypothetical protein
MHIKHVVCVKSPYSVHKVWLLIAASYTNPVLKALHF